MAPSSSSEQHQLFCPYVAFGDTAATVVVNEPQILQLRQRYFGTPRPPIGNVRGSGLFLGVELVWDRTTKEPVMEETSFICSYHILTSMDGLQENVLIINPPLCFISKEDCDYFVDKFHCAVVEDLSAAGDVRTLAKTPTYLLDI